MRQNNLVLLAILFAAACSRTQETLPEDVAEQFFTKETHFTRLGLPPWKEQGGLASAGWRSMG